MRPDLNQFPSDRLREMGIHIHEHARKENTNEHICRFVALELDDFREQGAIESELEEYRQRELAGWNPDAFAEEQIRGLVRQVFFPGWPKPAHQVVFSAVDAETDITSICMQVGLTLSAQVSGTTCLVEANLNSPGLERVVERNGHDLIVIPLAGQPSGIRRPSFPTSCASISGASFLAKTKTACQAPGCEGASRNCARHSITRCCTGRPPGLAARQHYWRVTATVWFWLWRQTQPDAWPRKR